MSRFCITSCYAFVPLDEGNLEPLRKELMAFGEERNMRGLTLIASEGINATVSGSFNAITEWKTYLTQKFGDITFKDSASETAVFRRWSVKIKTEIVGIKDPEIRPQGKHRHLSPEEWHTMLAQEDVIVLDARNAYEVSIGKFQNAIDPGIHAFHEFPQYARKSGIAKDKQILMYCTGGIRCEKALLAMEAEGYAHVYQLEGGILAYLAQFPQGNFEGECFVFDHRVSVDQNLRPSQTYGLCPHCGHAGKMLITCWCGKNQKICDDCAKQENQKTCSKRCANEALKVSPEKMAA